MKLMHLSDLHLGKRYNGFSMLEDQRYILEQILTAAVEEKPDGILLCGDIYDKSVPSAEAVELFDDFLSRLAEMGAVYIISGNHDSAERLAFGGRLMEKAGVYLSPVYDGSVTTVRAEDEFGTVQIHLLPFLKPVHVKRFYPEAEIGSCTDALRTALSGIDLKDGDRHVLLTHQFVSGSERCKSEEVSIGGSDQVEAAVFDGFDYVALGHLHGPQRAGGDHIRYCGTPLKYSFSEVRHRKSITLVTLGEKGSLDITTRELTPLHDLKEIRGSYDELMSRDYYLNSGLPDCYLHVTLTDEEDIPEAMQRLRTVYPYVMTLSYDNTRTRRSQNPMEAQAVPEADPIELFGLLYEKQYNRELGEEQRAYLTELMERIRRNET